MKIRYKTPHLAVCLTAMLAAIGVATTSLGQTIRPWNGGDGTGTFVGAASNWSGTLPVITGTGGGDIGQWSGIVAGNLTLDYNGGLASGFGNSGVSFSMIPPQTGNVNIYSPVGASPNLAILSISNDTASASFSLGNTSANILNIIWRPGNANQLHEFINNSTSPNIIYPNVRFQTGGGAAHVLLFQGTGDWILTNNLMNANGGFPAVLQKTGPGTFYWNGPSLPGALGNSTIESPITIAGGTFVLQHNTVLSPSGVGTSGSQNIVNNGTLFKYDAPSKAQTLTGVISGSGNLEVANGTLTLSGANTYTGNTILSGGTLILNRVENDGLNGPLGVAGTISFTGGALQYSVNNTFDYSPRFSTAASQSYRIDTGGQSATLTNALTSAGGTLTKLGSGTLTISGANTYSGLTTVSAGRLVIEGSASTGNITLANSTALGVKATGTPIAPTILTVGTSSSATLEFNSVSSTTTELIAAGTVSAGGTITVNVNGGTFAIGQSYPLFSWSSGSAPAVVLGTLTGAGGNLTTNANTIRLNITSLAFVWTGLTDGNWDVATANNWKAGGISAIFVNGNTALFDDTATGETNVTLNSPVLPTGVAVNSSAKIYSITSSGANLIGGSGGLTKNGSSTLTLAGGLNNYNGATAISGGTVSVGTLANGGAASDIGAANNTAGSLVLNGGTLQYTGSGATSDRLFTVGTGNGAVDASGSGALALGNAGAVALSGSGARTLTLSGSDVNDNTLAAVLGDSGGATALTKNGAGKWVLTGNNSYSGVTTIAAGTLQVGVGGASGSLGSGNIANNGSLIFNTSSTLTNGTISGTGTLTKDGTGKVVLPGDNSYAGQTTITAGTLQVGNGGATGKLSAGAPVVNDGTFIYDSTGTFTLSSVISGTGNVIVRGAGNLFQAIGANTYTGWTLIEPGSTFQPAQGNQGALASSVVTNNGILKLVRQDNGVFIYAGNIVGTGLLLVDANNVNVGDVTLTGTNTYTGGTIIANNTLVLGDGATPGAGTIVGGILFTNSLTPNENPRRVAFNHPEDFTFSELITFAPTLPFGNRGIVEQRGLGILTLTANNDYPGGTVISNGVIQVGNGGTTGAIGTGPVTVDGILAFNRANDLTFGGAISGLGSIVKLAAGTLTLTGTNNITGSLTVSNGALFMNNENFAITTTVYGGTLGGTGAFYGPITLEAGTTFSPGASANTIGTLTAVSDLTIGGDVSVQVNTSLAQSNDVAVVTGVLTKTGSGTLTVANLGPVLTVGTKFTLFSQPVTGGAALTVTGGGATWTNDLAVDGSITVATVTAPPTLSFTQLGNNLQFTWPGSGYKLQSQTNTLSVGISNNWGDYPGGGSSPVSVPKDITQGSVFFRLISTP